VDVGVLPLFFSPYSSGQNRALDVGIFGIYKRGISGVFSPGWSTAQFKQIYHLLGAWIATAPPPNIISAFKQVGIHVVWSELHNALEVRADVTTVRRLRDSRLPEEQGRQQKRVKLN
jgi:hypothetical protein